MEESERRVKTPALLQMEAVECGAAALGIVLGYYKHFVPLEELRVKCGVSRDGSKASNIARAARLYGLNAKGFRQEPAGLRNLPLPLIVFWNFNHFLVVEGFGGDKVYLNDPASGRRIVTSEVFDQSFTGVALTFEPTPEFKPGGRQPSLLAALPRRIAGSVEALTYLFLISLCLTVLGLIVPAFSRVFVDNILVAKQNWIYPLLAGMAITAIARGGVTWIQQYYLLRLEAKLSVSSSGSFMWHVLRLPVDFFSQRYVGDIAGRVQINDQVAQLLAGQLANAALNVITIGFYALLMLQYDVVLTVVGVAIAGLNILAYRYAAQRQRDVSQQVLAEQSKLSSTTLNGLQVIETLKSTGSESDFFARWAGYQTKASNASQNAALAMLVPQTVPVLLSALNTAVVLAVGASRVMDGHLTMGMLVAFQSLMSSFINPINQIMTLGNTIQQTEGQISRLDDVLHYQLDPRVAADDRQEFEPGSPSRLDGYLEVRDLTFGYSTFDPPLIEGLSFSMKPGDRIALVGASGSGKSTVAKVVAGLYEPWSGEILYDGKPRRDIPRMVLANSVAMVDQDIFLMEGNVWDNITMWDTTISQAEVVRALTDAAIHADVAARGGGYEASIEEAARNFSGGQRQRLEIARALAVQPSVVILDEATSALDTMTERTIDEALRRRGCTCLLIAHRLSTIRDCDEIIVLERGRVVQRGTHDEMIRVDGPYNRLVRTEAYQAERHSVLDRL